MAKQVKIKDIAEMAGVSAGTVDRILHNRGSVSAKSRAAVEKILSEVGYKYNIHTSAISVRKEFKVVISTPTGSIGEYWGSIQSGIEHALEEYNDININRIYKFYDQFDSYSCHEAFSGVISEKPDAVIIGPIFREETLILCSNLDKENIPYVFVDSVAEDTRPVESFTTDQYTCGYLLSKLLDTITPTDSSLAVFSTSNIGKDTPSNTTERMKGFEGYMEESGQKGRLKKASFSATDIDSTEATFIDFIRNNKDVKGIAVLNSRGYILADLLQAYEINDIKLISFDLTYNNRRCLRNGYISALLCQKPELQGFSAVKAIINKLLYNNHVEKPHHLMPIDVIFKENLPFYREI